MSILFLVFSGLAHWGLWNWLGSFAPGWRARHRRHVLGAMSVLFVLPFGRELVSVHPSPVASSMVAVGMVWQLTVVVTMLVWYLGRSVPGLLRLWARRTERAAAPARPNR